MSTKAVKVLVVCASLLFSFKADAYEIVAFRGLHQSMRASATPTSTQCTARMVNFEDHQFIENTIPSLTEAFRLGATIGHFNIRRTSDGHLVAFHDEDLACRTDFLGKKTSETSLAELKLADVGYGSTPDCGKTFPTRGRGVGLMPTIEEILAAFPERRFAINDKNADEETIDLLAKALSAYSIKDRSRFYYIGEAAALAQKKIPGINLLTNKNEAKKCLEDWLAGTITCQDRILTFPIDYARRINLQKLLSDFHQTGLKVWIFDVNTSSDARLARRFNVDAIGTYRLDRTIDLLKKPKLEKRSASQPEN